MNKYNLILKRIIEKKNISLLLVLTFLFVIVFSALTMINFVFDFRNDNLLKNISARTLYVDSENNDNNFDEISNIEHVEFNVSSKYLSGIYSDVPELDSGNLKGELEVLPLMNEDDISIVDGKNLENDLEMVCPSKFYPHDINIINEDETDFTTKMINSKILKGKEVIGNKYTLSNYDKKNEKNNVVNVTIVGTYDPMKTMNTLNTCYISKNDFDKLSNSYSGYGEYIDVDGNFGREFFDYSGRVVRVDNYSNVSEVSKKITDMGFSVMNVYQFDDVYLDLIIYIPLMVSIVAIIVSICIIYNFLHKKIRTRYNSYGLLCTLGFDKKDIKQIDYIENILISIAGFILGLVAYFALFYVLKSFVLTEFTYNSINIRVPFIQFLVSFVSISYIVYLVNSLLLRKVLSKQIFELINGD